MKPCGHENSERVQGCRACEIYALSPHARRRWEGVPRKEKDVKPVRGVYPSVKCAKLGEPTGEKVLCGRCPGRVQLTLFSCSQFGTCTTNKPVDGVACCLGCPGFVPEPEKRVVPPLAAPTAAVGVAARSLEWAYGVTTVPSRRTGVLPRTLASLREGGYPSPRLFVDGDRDPVSWEKEFGLPITARYPALRTIGSWVAALWELTVRQPMADRYALFQDDFVCSKNLRTYLEHCRFPRRGYLNLITFPSNEEIAPRGGGWYEARTTNPDVTWQTGRGAVALVFDAEGARDLLSSRDVVDRPRCAKFPTSKLDGMVVNCMNKLGYREYVHSPSLVLHTGEESTMGNPRHAKASSFRGEEFDLMGLLEK